MRRRRSLFPGRWQRGLAPLLLAVCGLLPTTTAAAKPPNDRPNFVFIIADDMFRDMLNYLPEGRGRNLTPHLDRLAAEGTILLGQHIVSPVCTPSRFNCLTGRYASRARSPGFLRLSGRLGMTCVTWNTQILPDDITLPRLLQQAGYATGMVGKNHAISLPRRLRVAREANPRDPAVREQLRAHARAREAAVRAAGFDYAGRIYPNNVDNFPPTALGVHNQDWITEGALEFIEANHDRPFYLYFATTITHSPQQPERSWRADPRATPEGFLERAPAVQPSRASLARRVRAAGVKGRLPETVLWLDDAIGALLDKLEATGVLDRTIIVFFNDNGQEAKGSIYEGGAACPSLIWRAGGFPCGHATSALVSNLDFAPTLLDFAGGHAPTGAFDGTSLRPLLEGRTNRIHDALFFELGFTRGVLRDGWKYLAFRQPAGAVKLLDHRKPGQEGAPYGHIAGNDNERKAIRQYPAYFAPDQLYDLRRDPGEQKNLADDPAAAGKLRELRARLREHLAGLPGGFAELKPARSGRTLAPGLR